MSITPEAFLVKGLDHPKIGERSISDELLTQAKALNNDPPKALGSRLVDQMTDEKRRDWKEENGEAIDAYYRRIKFNGVFGDGLRCF